MADNNKIYRSYSRFIGLLISCEFTVVVFLLAFSDPTELDFCSIFWLILSIFCGLETITGYLGYELNKNEKLRRYGKYFWYLTLYSFYIALTNILIFKELFLISLIPFLFLIYNIITSWTGNFYKNITKRKYKSIIFFSNILLFCVYPYFLGESISINIGLSSKDLDFRDIMAIYRIFITFSILSIITLALYNSGFFSWLIKKSKSGN